MQINIDCYSHFIKIQNPTYQLEQVLMKLASMYVLKSFQKNTHYNNKNPQPVKVFAGRTKDKKEYRFHANQLNHLISLLHREGYTNDQIQIRHHTNFDHVATLNAPLRSEWIPKDYQVPAIEYLANQDNIRSKLLAFGTGRGKTFTSLAAIDRINKRTAIVILPTYIDKWCGDITKTLHVKPKEIMVVQGSQQLKGLISLAQSKSFDSKFVIISSRTLQNFISFYEEEGYYETIDQYGITPDELYPLLGIGTVLIDETHQHIHAMYKMLLYTHVPLLIGLTATLISDNFIVERIHKIMYPIETRYKNPDFDNYIHAYAMAYSTTSIPPKKLRIAEWGSTVYSHNAYEKCILEKPWLAQKYLDIIHSVMEIGFIKDYQPGDKLAIYASTIAMCNAIVEYLKKRYTRFDIRRYCEDDPYENVIDPDIRVTTIISAGTAIDIPNLRVVILSNSIASSTSNLQVIGRLRKLPDRDVKFFYLYNENIPKQVEYHRRKKELLSDKTVSIKEFKCSKNL